MYRHARMHTHIHTHTTVYSSLDSVWDNPGEPVPKETFTHSHPSRPPPASSIHHAPWHPPCSMHMPNSPSTISLQVLPGPWNHAISTNHFVHAILYTTTFPVYPLLTTSTLYWIITNTSTTYTTWPSQQASIRKRWVSNCNYILAHIFRKMLNDYQKLFHRKFATKASITILHLFEGQFVVPRITLQWPTSVQNWKCLALAITDILLGLPFIPLHFLCTHFWQLVHCIELFQTSCETVVCVVGAKNLKWAMWHDNRLFRNEGCDLLWSTCLPNLKSLCLNQHEDEKATQNVEIRMVLGG